MSSVRDARVLNVDVCSCLAVSPTGFCHHRLGLQLHLGDAILPESFDTTPVHAGMRDTGKRRKTAPNRYCHTVNICFCFEGQPGLKQLRQVTSRFGL